MQCHLQLASKYLIHVSFFFSNIWNISCQNELLFNKLEDIADEELLNQKTMIWKCVENEEKINKETWNKICLFDVSINEKNQILRQDCIENAIKPVKSENDLYLTNCSIPESDRDSFDCFDHYNRVYLTQC